MTARELDAAGILDAGLRADYTACRRLNARHGRTYFLATRLLPADRRSAVHALYGFARHADDIVDDLGSGATLAEREAALDTLETEWEKALAGGRVAEPVVRAVADTRARYGIPAAHFRDFLASMRSDLSVRDYPTYEDLAAYMHGSAAVIGLQMVPVLGTVVPRAEAEPRAAALGVAFQLTNFLRDVGEDLDRGRVYLPADLLAAHGVDRSLLLWSRTTGRRDGRVTEALKDAASLTRRIYRVAEPGIAQLHSVSAPCVRTAFVLYRDILRAIEDDGFSVLHRRAVVGRRRRLAVAGRGYVRAVAARRGWPGAGSGTDRLGADAAPPPAPDGETARAPRASRAGGEKR
ncbi:phytoene/squalene synthase family protein [Streptomyces sp. adm13(2018)]|uniref:phytoene/squalene synthase family protein n=1 Tax=Streptomyces sp. adm13(2018) TaxID=2479007 RepID=UPI0011CDF761|nr:phytoene/squalene synthase family protein [Streptomyces sp. adm13(2018)]TXS31277.1 phytoene/squalene synthase family protein [Streptomyces sp. adm13(2018)]